ncbi:MAG: diguanylate cyclase [Thermodesulfovibrionales bacterium]|jgi:diguanylate cyclase (GGDEF)-like protein
MKILIAEDDPVSRRLLEAKLVKWGYDVVVTKDGNEASQALIAEGAPQLIILDWMMPGMDGVEVCRKVREEMSEPYKYIILLTALQREEDIVAGMEAGADDYITKPFKSNELRVRIRAGRRILELQDELIAAREIQREKATHDPLTTLWNHEEILRILAVELARAERQKTRVGVIMADLDHFKNVNDTYGHMAGDVVLRLTAKRMLSLLRPYDAIGRYGGEEFLIVLPEDTAQGVSDAAERLRTAVAANSMDTSEGMIAITISLGVAVSSEGGGGEPGSLVRAADAALYRAKQKGRNRMEVANEEATTASPSGQVP